MKGKAMRTALQISILILRQTKSQSRIRVMAPMSGLGLGITFNPCSSPDALVSPPHLFD
jgi:hypothetical protein